MGFLFKNRIFRIAATLAVLQQVFVGLSTFIIGRAGASLADPHRVIELLGDFFGSIGVAYLFGTALKWLSVRLANQLWADYLDMLLRKLSRDMGYASESNKRRTNTWLTGEAHATLEYASHFSLDFISVSCNVLFTVVAFLAILGPLITASITVALVSSFGLLWAARRQITAAGGRIQNSKMRALLSVQSLWDQFFFGNSKTRAKPIAQAQTDLTRYFRQTEYFKLAEQAVSCLPIFLSMAILYLAINYQMDMGKLVLPSLVAVLPRSLQLFQNVHTISTYSSQFLLLRAKLHNLQHFPDHLDHRQAGAHIDKSGISIIDVTSGDQLGVDDLLQRLQGTTGCDAYDPGRNNKAGRLRIIGRNGAGKSSLLRDLKAWLPDSVLIGPGVQLLPPDARGSTGQLQIQTLAALMEHGVDTLLLDEWDANLDHENTRQLDAQLAELSQRALIIEVGLL